MYGPGSNMVLPWEVRTYVPDLISHELTSSWKFHDSKLQICCSTRHIYRYNFGILAKVLTINLCGTLPGNSVCSHISSWVVDTCPDLEHYRVKGVTGFRTTNNTLRMTQTTDPSLFLSDHETPIRQYLSLYAEAG